MSVLSMKPFHGGFVAPTVLHISARACSGHTHRVDAASTDLAVKPVFS